MASTLSVKLDSQLAKAVREYVQRSRLTPSKAARRLLRKALGIPAADGDQAEEVMDAIATHNREVGTRARGRAPAARR